MNLWPWNKEDREERERLRREKADYERVRDSGVLTEDDWREILEKTNLRDKVKGENS